jgi:CHAT domain-containing protein/tetratricopeptide (TPR) repeat protein
MRRGLASSAAALLAASFVAGAVLGPLPVRDPRDAFERAERLRSEGSAAALRRALVLFGSAWAAYRARGDRGMEGEALSRLAWTHELLGEPSRARALYEEALPMLRAAGEWKRAAQALQGLGATQRQLGDLRGAVRANQEAFAIQERIGAPTWGTLNNIGVAYWALEEHQLALDAYAESLRQARAGADRQAEGYALNNLGSLYRSLGDTERALEHHGAALEIRRSLGDVRGTGMCLHNLGLVEQQLRRDLPAARRRFEAALPDHQRAGNRIGEAYTREALGLVASELGDHGPAIDELQRAVRLWREMGARLGEAGALAALGRVHAGRGEEGPARASYEAALARGRASLDRLSQMRALYGLARLDRDGGDLDGARTRIEECLEMVRAVRSALVDPELRRRYRGAVDEYYDFYVDLLMRLHQRHPRGGYDALGFQAAERGRARVLLETLAAARADRGARPALSAPTAVGPDQVQPLLEHGRALLAFALGAEGSYLWVVTSEAVRSVRLPPRDVVEGLARTVHGSLEQRRAGRADLDASTRRRLRSEADRRLAGAAAELSRTVLGPVAQDIAGRPLVLVLDGALQYVPFAALPAPAPGAAPLREHELVRLPSASVLPVLRQAGPPAGQGVAIVADPVLDPADARLGRFRAAVRGASSWPRLPWAEAEARAVASAVPAARKLVLLGLEAQRAAVLGPDLADYRLLHFAAHGVFDSERPDRSGLLLSRLDAEGRPIEGFLGLADVYSLRLDADLVTLSACETALGREIRGEGLIGLTRGFLHAGARRVLASLWSVEDESTAALMGRFYALLGEGRPAPEALRLARDAVRQKPRWSSPYYWAGFVLEGDWR